jgi:lysophospholipase L1-like esterase
MRLRSCLLALLSVFAPATTLIAQSTPPATELTRAFRANDRILFQGDSITDGNRGRSSDPNHILGHSYAFLIAARYATWLPERHLTFVNRGISGNRVSDLAKRWSTDTLDLKPTLLSILIGINDLSTNVSAAQFELQYDQLLADTRKALPTVRLVLCEPFGLPTGRHKTDWAVWRVKLAERQQIVAKLATRYRAALVHLQRAFDDASRRAPADYWIWDGIHPTYAGHQILADEWVRTVANWKPAPRTTTPPAAEPAARPGAQPSAIDDQDGPGLYRVSAGPGGKYSTILRAKSREDAIDKGLATVARKAMDYDENVEIKQLKVEKVGR